MHPSNHQANHPANSSDYRISRTTGTTGGVGRLAQLEEALHDVQAQAARQAIWLRRGVVLMVLLLVMALIGGYSYGTKKSGVKHQQQLAEVAKELEAVAAAKAPAKTGIELVPSNDATILKLQKAAAGGDLKAQFDLAQRYEMGRGVLVNTPLALSLLQNSAAGGHQAAMFDLANAHATGRLGLTLDKTAAARWYEAAAITGHAMSAFRLGELYETGLDGAPDLGLALGWYQRAAGLGADSGLAAIARLTPKKPPIGTDEIRQMQLALRQLGYDIGVADGKMGPRTVEALKAYQSQIGMMADGRPSHFVLDRLAQDKVAQGG